MLKGVNVLVIVIWFGFLFFVASWPESLPGKISLAALIVASVAAGISFSNLIREISDTKGL